MIRCMLGLTGVNSTWIRIRRNTQRLIVSIPGIPVSLQGSLPIREKAEPAEPLHDERETVDGSPDIAMSEGMQVQDMWEEHLPYSSSYSDEPTLSISEIQHLIKRMFLGDF